MGFFELRTPEDMLEKAKRELRRLENEFSIDHVFNFFVTASHITDYFDEPLKGKLLADPFDSALRRLWQQSEAHEIEPQTRRPANVKAQFSW